MVNRKYDRKEEKMEGKREDFEFKLNQERNIRKVEKKKRYKNKNTKNKNCKKLCNREKKRKVKEKDKVFEQRPN